MTAKTANEMRPMGSDSQACYEAEAETAD